MKVSLRDKIIQHAQRERDRDNPLSIHEIAQFAQNVYNADATKATEMVLQLQKRVSELDKIADLIHYPDCWCTTAYPTLFDAINEFWDFCHDCTRCDESERY